VSRPFAKLFAVALCLATVGPLVAQDRAPEREPSIVGTWEGTLTIVDTKVKVTTTFRADGTYKTVMENGNYVSVEKGKYTYADEVLTTEPEGGLTGTFTVKFDGANTATFKGGGISITCKRK
jgi:hypothetical protein